MNAFEVTERFGLDQMVRVTRDDESLGTHNVRIKIEAVSVNYRDILMVKGLYNPKQPLPLIPCSDGAGTVLEVGSGVTQFAIGDRVTSCFFADWVSGEPTREKMLTSVGGPVPGMLRDTAVVGERGLIRQPAGYDHAEASTLPCAALTAWNALTLNDVQPGHTVLIQGTGGVSMFALQFAVAMGARVIVTSSSDEKLQTAISLGASEGINYRTDPQWSRPVRAMTKKRGVDLVVEVGGAGTLEHSIRSVKPGGTIALIGVLAGGASNVNVIPVLMQQIKIQGVLVGHRESYDAMIRAIEQIGLKPLISDRFDFAESIQAFEHQAAGKHFGKVVIDI